MMYFRNLLCLVTFATLASTAVAKQIPSPYTSDESDSTTEDVFERDAEPEPEPARTAVWEAAHGGPAPSYKYGEEHDAGAWHIAREAEPMPEAEPEPEAGWANVGGNRQHKPAKWASWLSKKVIPTVKPFATKGGLKKYHGKPHHARDADGAEIEDFDIDEIDDDELEKLYARGISTETLEIPDFGDEEVDTSLEGLLHARDVDDDEDSDDDDDDDSNGPYFDDSQEDLSGYDAGILQRRSDGSADEIDYSLEGYDTFYDDDEDEESKVIRARDLADDEIAADDDYLHSDEHREFLASLGVTERSFEDDIEDAEHDRLDARDVKDIDDEEVQIPDFGDEEVDTSLEGMELEARGVEDEEDEEFPDFGDKNVDTSLEGYDEPLQTRGVDEEEDEDSEDYDADAAYDGAEVVEEFMAPEEPELE